MRRKEQDQVSRWSYTEALKEESVKDTYFLLRNAKGLKKKKWGNTHAGEETLLRKKKKKRKKTGMRVF